MHIISFTYIINFLFVVFILDLIFFNWLFLRLLISSHSVMKGLFIIISCTKNIFPGVACNFVWCVLGTAKSVSDIIPDQGSSFSGYIFFK